MGGAGERVLERGGTGVDATGSKVDGCEEKHEPEVNPGGTWPVAMKGRWDLVRLRLEETRRVASWLQQAEPT